MMTAVGRMIEAMDRDELFRTLFNSDEKQWLALAALRALREPTPTMKAAASNVVGNYDIAHEALVQAIDAAIHEAETA